MTKATGQNWGHRYYFEQDGIMSFDTYMPFSTSAYKALSQGFNPVEGKDLFIKGKLVD